MHEIIESSVDIMGVYGKEASVKRGAKVAKLPDGREQTIDEAVKSSKSLQNGDKIITGKRTVVTISSGVKGESYQRGTTLTLMPNSEAKVNMVEWDSTKDEEGEDVRRSGRAITNTELIKGVFSISSSEPFSTPTVEFTPTKQNSIIVEIKEDSSTVFSLPGAPLPFKCKATGKRMELKSTLTSEVIVTRDGIYRKGIVDIDQRFNMLAMTMITAPSSAIAPSLQHKDSDKMMQESMQHMKTFNPQDIVKGLASFQTMDPTKIPGLTPEQVKQMQDAQKQMAALEKKQGKSMASAFKEAADQRERAMKDPRMAKIVEEMPAKMKEMGRKTGANLEEALDKYDALPSYPPLHKDFKIG
jgi:hypothetical protein